jgi:DNA-binding NtrC family response regulator
MLERTLISVGFSVLRAENGDQAIRDFVGAADTIDVLLTDIVMPGTAQGPGVAVAFTQRSSRIQPVFMSGYPRDSEIGNAELGTGWRFLTKPVRRDDLVDAVGAAARAARSQPPEKRTVGS